MKISLNWLCEYVDVSDFKFKPKELAEKLTQAGLEVEGFADLSVHYKNVVLGHIIELGKHPNADRLTVCQVDVGEGKVRQIVCGAKNHKQGDRVVAALPGAVLPGDFQIKESKIRDIESRGMLCSEVELGLAKESPGIMILPKDVTIGQAFAEYYGLDDVVFELKVTPNRSDCLSHLGLAREIGCLINRPVHLPKPQLKVGGAFTKKSIHLELKDSRLCPRYAGRAIKGVKVGPSPEWLRRRLEILDLNSINNVVDVTNYVMMELGQPLHAFDIKRLTGAKVIVEKARNQESFTTLDGTNLKLTGEELTIRDGERAVALAGVVGGQNSGVSENTTDLFIESAHFTAETVRKTARRFGIQTDSAYRFSRGTDPEGVVLALQRACELIQKVAGGEVASDHYDEFPDPPAKRSISVLITYLSERLGYEANASDFESWMKRLGCEVKKGKKSGEYQVIPPLYRWDLSDKTDLVEEYARLNGYDKIGETFPPLAGSPLSHAAPYRQDVTLVDVLRGLGVHQAVNFGFESDVQVTKFLGARAILTALGVETSEQSVKVQNPLSEELGSMRVSLLPGLFRNVVSNFRYGNEVGRLFEVGQVFKRQGEEYHQAPRLGLAAWGTKLDLWQKSADRPAVFDLKSIMEGVLSRLNIQSYKWDKPDQVPAFLHPGQTTVLVCEGRPVGFIGSLHPEFAEAEKLRVSVALGEFDVEKLMRGQPRQVKVQSLSKYPLVERDLALVMPRTMSAGEVVREITKAAGSVLNSVRVFDVFTGGNLSPEQQSVGFRLTLQSPEGTLTDEQLTQLQAQILKAVSTKLGIGVR